MIYRLSSLQSRSTSAENPEGRQSGGGTVANGLKGSPAIKDFRPGATAILLDQSGPGCIRHIWMTSHDRSPEVLRNLILRMFWEGAAEPSVEAPLGDFFGVAHGATAAYQSAFLNMQEGRGFNCYFPMPFGTHRRITVSNESEQAVDWLFYQIDFTLGDAVGPEDGRFHARFRRENPCPLSRDFTIVETGGGRGIYLGCVLGVRPLTLGWWGEGEVKIYLDDDTLYPTICGTGTEDYIGAAWGLAEHAALYQGAPLHRHDFTSIYRLHGPDPVYFQHRLQVTLQQMGCDLRENVLPRYGAELVFTPKNHPRRPQSDGFYLRSDDWCATAYWYQWPLSEGSPLFPDRAARSANLWTAQAATGTAGL